MADSDWRVGSKLVHPYDPDLGTGVVRSIEGRFLQVYFPAAERELTLSSAAGLRRLVLDPGQWAVVIDSDEEVEIEETRGHEYRLSDGRIIGDAELWPLVPPDSPVERLARLEVDAVASFRNRVDGLRLMEVREAGGLGSFLGGRIELFPHQLHTALQAVRRDPVRWLLADEVGLGKTIEASLILSALVRTGRSERAIVIAPETLTVQWLGELYRKFHQVFTLLDSTRLAYAAKQFGEEFNPFVAHQNSVIALERLLASPELLEHAAECDPDLIVVDEAHRLCDPWLAERLGPVVERARHALLLTATPLQADRAGFYRLLGMLHPDAFPSYETFDRAVDAGDAVLPCTSAVRREDLGGLPPRVPIAVDLPAAHEEIGSDPRAAWLADSALEWRARSEKALVFVHDTDTLEVLRAWISAGTGLEPAVFHEDLPLEERDIALARFRETDEPLLLCSEAGGEGRNFQFCDRMVHWDLPLDPIRLEQRIGRLDRIGRDKPVEIVYFRCARERPDVARLYERLGLFATPSAGIDAALGGVERALAEAVNHDGAIDMEALERAVRVAREGTTRAAPRVFYPDAYDPSKAEEVMALVPSELDRLTRDYCVAAARDLGLKVHEKGGARYYLELELGVSSSMLSGVPGGKLSTNPLDSLTQRVESLPGVGVDALPGYTNEVRFLGTFDREDAIQNQSLAFFASGQMLVEGLLLELEDGMRGRATLFELRGTGERGAGLICIYKDGPRCAAVVVDARGRLRPEWADVVIDALPGAVQFRAPESPTQEWTQAVRELGAIADGAGTPGRLNAAAFFRFV